MTGLTEPATVHGQFRTRHRTQFQTGFPCKDENGVVITLVAVFMLFVTGAMAALSIDVVTIYTARSEAQLAADSAALAAARVLANSGVTSPGGTGVAAAADTLAQTLATQVASQNQVGGTNLNGGNLAFVFGGNAPNPTVTVTVQVSNLPTFFARIWGRTKFAVSATATAEVYNPSLMSALGAGGGPTTPVAPICVKPWLLPNMDPSDGNAYIFDTASGAVNPKSNLLGSSQTMSPATLTCPRRGNCTVPAPAAWNYYPGNDDPTSFPHPTSSLPTCSRIATPTDYENSIAGCISMPIACNSTNVNIDITRFPGNRNTQTADAVNCLTNSNNSQGDTLTTTAPPNQPFQFIAGADNPAAVANPTFGGQNEMVSDSLVTVPVFNSTTTTNPVTLIGFVQLFLNPQGTAAPTTGKINTTVVNLVGCGTNATGQPIIIGNGTSPMAVRLISPS